jgi:hypothetical protein
LNFLVYRRPVYLRHRKIDPTLSPLGAWRKALRFNFQNKTIAELERRFMTINTVPGGQNANPNSNSNPNYNNNNNDDNISKIDPPPLRTTITRAVGTFVQDKQHQQPEYDEVMGSSSSSLLLLGDTIASASKTNTITLDQLSTHPNTTLLKEEDIAPQEPLQQQQQQQQSQVPIGNSSSTENEMDHNSTTTSVEGRRYHTALKE